MKLLEKTTGDKSSAYVYLRKAAEMNHLKARAEMAWAYLLGHYLNLNYEYASKEFEILAKQGVPEANLVIKRK